MTAAAGRDFAMAALRRYINQLGERENIDQVFLVADKQLRANRNGNLYLQLRLMDKTGSLTGMLWNASDQVFNSVETGNYLRVAGTTQIYNGQLQMIVTRVEPTDPRQIDEQDFVTVSTEEIDRLARRLTELLRGVRNVHLRNLAECFLADEHFMGKFTTAPAGIKNHHAYRGGLLAHVVSLMEVCRVVAPMYPDLDGDLLLTGAFLHDAGKIDELTYEREFGYSDEGQLIGHMIMILSTVEAKVAEAERLAGEPFPRELLLRLKHMIVSHHGEYQFGSPKLPMTLEAIASPLYPDLDADLLLLGAFLHDAGKIDELTYDREFGYSDAGQLIGHVVMVLSTVEDKIAESENLAGEKFPEELALRLKHLIVSHHGEYEFGSPKLPMTLEAIALHLLDNLDAKLYSVAQILKEDASGDSAWTSYNQALGRKFFKGQARQA